MSLEIHTRGPVSALFVWILILLWIFGLAVSKGFWLALGCVLLPPVAWVTAINWILSNFGLV